MAVHDAPFLGRRHVLEPIREHRFRCLVLKTAAACFVALVVASSCAADSDDLEPKLPRFVGGVEIAYDRLAGPELTNDGPNNPGAAVADELNVPVDIVTYVTGYRDDQSTYNSDIIQVRGADTAQLLDAVIKAYKFTGERRVDRIAGKAVVRAATPEWSGSMDETPYFYAFGDVAVVIVGQRPFVEEALRQLP